jgi:hypothetical protein
VSTVPRSHINIHFTDANGIIADPDIQFDIIDADGKTTVVYVYVYMCVCTCMLAFMCVYVCVCTYVSVRVDVSLCLGN